MQKFYKEFGQGWLIPKADRFPAYPLFPPEFRATYPHSQDLTVKVMAQLQFSQRPHHPEAGCSLSSVL